MCAALSTCTKGTDNFSSSFPTSAIHPMGTLRGLKSHTTVDTEWEVTWNGTWSLWRPIRRLKGTSKLCNSYNNDDN